MPLTDPAAWAQAATAFKTIFEGLRSAIGLVKDVNATAGGNAEQKRLVDEALNTAASATRVAEAEIAKALGYELCKCEFPPTAMLTVGHIDIYGERLSRAVFECPKCSVSRNGR